MICLDIKVKNKYSNYLYRIFSEINVFDYIWEINADDFLYNENGETNEKLFYANELDGEKFSRCISKESYYMIFTDIKAYPLDKKT